MRDQIDSLIESLAEKLEAIDTSEEQATVQRFEKSLNTAVKNYNDKLSLRSEIQQQLNYWLEVKERLPELEAEGVLNDE